MKSILINILTILLCYLNAYSQRDGTIVEKVEIRTVEELVGYVQQSEGRDSAWFTPDRFKHLASVHFYGITYLSDGLRVKGFLITPRQAGKYPCVIYNRGGSLEFGSLSMNGRSILGHLARLASEGFVVAASQYRGNGGGEGQEEYGGADINDILNLVPLLANEPMADTARLGMYGWSRGGMMTFLTLPRTTRIKAVVLGAPSTNLVRSVQDRPELMKNWSVIIPGFNGEERTAALLARSPLFHADQLPTDVPVLIFQGGKDTGLLPEYTLRMALELDRFKVPFRLIKYEDGGHGLFKYREEVFAKTIEWFDKYL